MDAKKEIVELSAQLAKLRKERKDPKDKDILACESMLQTSKFMCKYSR